MVLSYNYLFVGYQMNWFGLPILEIGLSVTHDEFIISTLSIIEPRVHKYGFLWTNMRCVAVIQLEWQSSHYFIFMFLPI